MFVLKSNNTYLSQIKDVLKKPFDLEELRHRLHKFWVKRINTPQLETDLEMTLLVEETESSSLVEQQQYWA